MGLRKFASGRWREIFQLLSPLGGCVSRKILDRGCGESKEAVWRTNPARERQEAACPWRNAVQRDLCARLGRQGGCWCSPNPWQLFWSHEPLKAWCLRWSGENLTASSPQAHGTPSYPAVFYQMIPTALWKERHCPRMRLPATPSSIIRHLLNSSPEKGR